MTEFILQVGHPVLRAQARALSRQEILSPKIKDLVEKRKEIMREAPGVGLAAPQIGISQQIIVIEDRPEYMKKYLSEVELKKRGRVPIPFHVLFNPKIVKCSKERAYFFEGCLSSKGLFAETPRALYVVVEALNENAELITIEVKGWHARILQHETDHLAGNLFIDRTNLKTLSTLEHYLQFWQNPAC